MSAIVVQLQWRSGYLVDYYINTDSYRALCVNKALPEMNCDGKCILAEKLKKQKQQKKDESNVMLLPISFEFTFISYITEIQEVISHQVISYALYYSFYTFLSQIDIFKPPS